MAASRTTSFDQCAQAVAFNSRTTRGTANGEHSAPAAGQTPEWPKADSALRLPQGRQENTDYRAQTQNSRAQRSRLGTVFRLSSFVFRLSSFVFRLSPFA